MHISSASNPKVKYLVRLAQEAKARRQTSTCLVEGPSLVIEALEHNSVTSIYHKEGTPIPNNTGDIEVISLSEACFSKVTTLKTNDILAEVEQPTWDLSPSTWQRVLIADRIQNPDNLGGLIRSAHAAGFQSVLCLDGCADRFHPRTVRASMGSVLRLETHTLSLTNALSISAEHNIALCALAMEGAEDLFTQSIAPPLALVVGNEGQGVHPELTQAAKHTLAIPMAPGVESLNALAAASLAMYYVSSHIKNHKEG